MVRNARRNTILKTKALLGALVVAVLAVFGVIGLRNAPDAKAGDLAGATAFNPSAVLVGGSASTTLTLYDDRIGLGSVSTITATVPAGLTITASSTVLASNIGTACAVAATGLGTQVATLNDAGCDANSTSEPWLWTLTVTCTTAGTYT